MQDPNWQDRYRARVVTPREAVARIAAGRRILIGSGAAEPTTLVRALVDHGEHLADNQIVHLLTLGPAPYVQPEMAGRFRHTAFFIGSNVRDAVQAGRAAVALPETVEHVGQERRIDARSPVNDGDLYENV